MRICIYIHIYIYISDTPVLHLPICTCYHPVSSQRKQAYQIQLFCGTHLVLVTGPFLLMKKHVYQIHRFCIAQFALVNSQFTIKENRRIRYTCSVSPILYLLPARFRPPQTNVSHKKFCGTHLVLVNHFRL